MIPAFPERRRTAWPLAGLVIGILAAAGALYAHQTGVFPDLFHHLGLHDAHQTATESGVATASMPGMEMGGTRGMAEPSSVPGYTVVTVAPERQQLIGVRTGKVERDRLLMSVRAVGIVELDQTRLARIQTRINGWVKKVYVNYAGQNVKQGDPLLDISTVPICSLRRRST
jgi:multidrug efflux pump subunit AcrA (membrane-fusion protein)